MTNPFSTIENLVKDKSEDEVKEALSGFMRRLYHPEEDCDEGDCEDLTCPECGGELETVFGSLPLEVRCKSCEKKFVLREILLQSL